MLCTFLTWIKKITVHEIYVDDTVSSDYYESINPSQRFRSIQLHFDFLVEAVNHNSSQGDANSEPLLMLFWFVEDFKFKRIV